MEYFHTVVLILKLRLWIPTGCEKDIEKTDNRCETDVTGEGKRL